MGQVYDTYMSIQHKNYLYVTNYELEDEENLKREHYAYKTGEESIRLDYSPYKLIDLETFQMIVEMNFPARKACVPWDRDSIIKEYVEYKRGL